MSIPSPLNNAQPVIIPLFCRQRILGFLFLAFLLLTKITFYLYKVSLLTDAVHITNKTDVNMVLEEEGGSLFHPSAFIRITCTGYCFGLGSQAFSNNHSFRVIHSRQTSEGPSV